MRLLWWKVAISFPLFLWFFLHLNRKYRTKVKKKRSFREDKFYFWVKRYTSYLIWLYGYKLKNKTISLWNEKSGCLVLNKIDPIAPLMLIKINNFDNNAPLTILFDETTLRSLSFILKRFYLLLNYFIWTKTENHYRNINVYIENIKIPRNLVFFLDFNAAEIAMLKEVINLPYGAFAQIIFVNCVIKTQQVQITFADIIHPNDIVKLNKTFLISKIKKWTS